jgi:hypothetical protein
MELQTHFSFCAYSVSDPAPFQPAAFPNDTGGSFMSRSMTPGEIERDQDHEEEGHKTENEFYYTHRCRLFPLRQEALLFMGCTARVHQTARLMKDSAPRWTSLS